MTIVDQWLDCGRAERYPWVMVHVETYNSPRTWYHSMFRRSLRRSNSSLAKWNCRCCQFSHRIRCYFRRFALARRDGFGRQRTSGPQSLHSTVASCSVSIKYFRWKNYSLSSSNLYSFSLRDRCECFTLCTLNSFRNESACKCAGRDALCAMCYPWRSALYWKASFRLRSASHQREENRSSFV